MTAEQAMVFVRERGNAMATASAATPTGMTAVLGGDRDEVLAKLAEHGLTPANDNGAGQIVAAGTMEQLAKLADDAPEKARLIPLSVAGAFHTEHMRPAVDVLAQLARAISTHDTRTRLISNRDGQIVHSGHETLKRLVTQVSNPVRWDLCMQTMLDLGVTGIIEMPPAGTLVGHRQAPDEGRRDVRAQDARPARRRARVRRQARRRLPHRLHAHLADARLAVEGHVPPGRRRRHGHRADAPASSSARSPTCAARPRSSPRTAAPSSSGSSKTATSSPPVSPSSDCTPKANDMTASIATAQRRRARRDPRHRRLPAEPGRHQRRDRRPDRLRPTSGSGPARASSSAGSPSRTRPCR